MVDGVQERSVGSAEPVAPAASTGPTLTYRGDIDGLRAVAVALVVLYHAGVPGFDGGYVGVDVFFVISGYLITSGLVAQAERRRLSLIGFYAGRARRLLPLALTTIVTTVAMGVWLLPVSRSDELLGDARSAILYVSNWRFADKSVAYVDTQVSDGMLTHFWSLSIEEQYYFGWPLLVAGAAMLVRFVPRFRVRQVVAVVAGLIVLISLAASIMVTADEGARAYYLTHLRLWEIGAGAVLATTSWWRDRATPFSSAAQVAALVAIVVTANRYGDTTPFPGSAAIVPVVATVVLIALGGGTRPTDRLLRTRPMRIVGEHSYALYLWHWPALGVLSLLDTRYGWDQPGWLNAGLAVAAAWVLSMVSHRLIENPVRYSSVLKRMDRPTVAVGVGATVACALAVTPLATWNLDQAAQDWADAPITPAEATDDTVTALYHPCHEVVGADFVPFDWCELGDPDGSVTIALAGDSHAQHWAPAFDQAGRDNGWRVLLATRSSCVPYDIPVYAARFERMDPGCNEWGEFVRTDLADQEIDVYVVGRRYAYLNVIRSPDGREVDDAVARRTMREGVAAFAADVAAFADRLVILEDTPAAPFLVPDCLDGTGPDFADECEFPAVLRRREQDLIDDERAGLDAAGVERAWMASLTDAVCPNGTCPALLDDGTITFRDSGHMTAGFSRSLGDAVADLIRAALDDELDG